MNELFKKKNSQKDLRLAGQCTMCDGTNQNVREEICSRIQILYNPLPHTTWYGHPHVIVLALYKNI